MQQIIKEYHNPKVIVVEPSIEDNYEQAWGSQRFFLFSLWLYNIDLMVDTSVVWVSKKCEN